MEDSFLLFLTRCKYANELSSSVAVYFTNTTRFEQTARKTTCR